MRHNWWTAEAGRVIWGLLRWMSDISKNRDSATSLGSPFQFSVTLTIKRLFSCFNSFYASSIATCFVVLWLDNTEKGPAMLFISIPTTPCSHTYRKVVFVIVNLLFSSLNPTQFSQTVLLFQVFQFPDHLCGPLLDVFQYAYICLERQLRASLHSAGRMTKIWR